MQGPTPNCAEYHRTQIKHGEAIARLESDLLTMKTELDEIGDIVTRTGEKQQSFADTLGTLQMSFTGMERQITMMAADYVTMRRDLTEMRDTTKVIERSSQDIRDLLNGHIGAETLQYREYAESTARLTGSLETMNRHLLKIAMVGSLLVVALSMAISKYDLLTMLGIGG